MGLTARERKTESTFEIVTQGMHPAVCTWLVDIGPQEVEWSGKTKIQEKVKLRFEIPNERAKWTVDGVEHEGPKVIWATYTNSLGDRAKLRAHLEMWRGRPFTAEELQGFDLRNVVGKPCLLTVVHNEATSGQAYANIMAIGPLVKGMEAPKAEGETLVFDLDNYTDADFDKLPEWLQELVQKGETLKAKLEKAADEAPPPHADDEIPF